MVKKGFIFFSCLLFLSLFYFTGTLFFPKKGHYKEYQKTIDQRVKLTKMDSRSAHHKREHVQKEIYLSQKNQRTHSRLYCENSDLFLVPEGKKMHLIEKLENIKCWMQDSLSEGNPPTQQIRYLTAQKGTYLFPSHHFYAHEISLQFYYLPGVEIPLYIPSDIEPFLKGVAKEVSFSLSERVPSFQAKHLKTTFEIDEIE